MEWPLVGCWRAEGDFVRCTYQRTSSSAAWSFVSRPLWAPATGCSDDECFISLESDDADLARGEVGEAAKVHESCEPALSAEERAHLQRHPSRSPVASPGPPRPPRASRVPTDRADHRGRRLPEWASRGRGERGDRLYRPMIVASRPSQLGGSCARRSRRGQRADGRTGANSTAGQWEIRDARPRHPQSTDTHPLARQHRHGNAGSSTPLPRH